MSEDLHLEVPGVDGWSYLAFDVDIAAVVIRARERWEDLQGLGG